jgi:hypothetical protein
MHRTTRSLAAPALAALALVAGVGLAACGDDDTTDVEGNQTPTTVAEDMTESTEMTDEEDMAPEDEEMAPEDEEMAPEEDMTETTG